VTQFIAAHVSADQVFHPQLTGDGNLAKQPLRLATLGGGQGPIWRQLEALVSASRPLTVSANKATYVLGDALVLNLQLPKAGYLNVINVDADDEPAVLFPNRFQQDNGVNAGALALPTPQMTFALQATKPGPGLTVAFLTEQPVNLYKSGFGERDDKGNLLDIFSTLSPKGIFELRATFTPVAKQQAPVLAGQVLTRVCNNAAECR